MADIAVGSLPFREQIAFFRGKQNLGTQSWTDIWQEQHDNSFVIAGAMKADLVNDFRTAVDKVVAEGATLQEFRKDFDNIVAQHGWEYNGGRNWRTRVIYDTNLRTSYQAGRYAQLNDPDLLSRRPYWMYVHSDLVVNPREEHLAWDGLVLAADDPFWDTHYPPNGWGCKCTVRPVSERQLRSMGKTGPDKAPTIKYETVTVGARGPSPRTVEVPEGIDPGWAYAPGQSVIRGLTPAMETMTDRLAVWPADIGATTFSSVSEVLVPRIQASYSRWVDELVAGQKPVRDWKVISAAGSAEIEYLAGREIYLQSAEIAIQDSLIIGRKQERHIASGDALSIDEFRLLPTLLSGGPTVIFDTVKNNLLYILASENNRNTRIVVEPNFTLKGQNKVINAVRSAAKVSTDSINSRIKGKQYILIRGEK